MSKLLYPLNLSTRPYAHKQSVQKHTILRIFKIVCMNYNFTVHRQKHLPKPKTLQWKPPSLALVRLVKHYD